MVRGLSAVLLIAFVVSVRSVPCDDCSATYTTDKGSATAPDGKCTALKTYIDCVRKISGCSIFAEAATVKTDLETLGEDCKPSLTCLCEKDYVIADVTDSGKKCQENKNFISCLAGKTDTGCDGSSTVTVFATAAESAMGTPCKKSPVCSCEIEYAKADLSTPTKKCTAAKKFSNCTFLTVDEGCGASTKKADVGNLAEKAISDLGNDCSISKTCKCQLDFNKASLKENDKCKSANDFVTCLEKIETGNENGCADSLTTAKLKTEFKTKVQAVLCSSGFRAQISLITTYLLLTTHVIFNN